MIWLGTAGWSYFPDWVGSFYPLGTTQSTALARYVEAFTFVEIDSTFYAVPAETTLRRWADTMPVGFRVAPKAPKSLTQETGLRVPDVPFGHFTELFQSHFGARLARIVVQMPPSFTRTTDDAWALRRFVERWSARVPLALELRHESWRTDGLVQFCRDQQVTLVGSDLHDYPDLSRASFDTSDDAAYIRLIGQHDGIGKDRVVRPQTNARAWWVDRVSDMIARGVRNVFIVANNHYEGHAPATLRTLATELTDAGLPVAPFRGTPNGPLGLFD
jgi:uncharacterized protein YecE (DUF72 family)